MTISQFFDILTSPFVLRALLAGALISVCAAVLGVVLVLKKYALIGHGLSDVGFLAIVVSTALAVTPIGFALPCVLVCSVAIIFVSQKHSVAGDTAIGIAATCALALGVIIARKSGATVDLTALMFGSILAVSKADLIFALVACPLIMLVFVLCYNKLFLITSDEVFARARGINANIYHLVVAVLTSFVVVIGLRLMGSLLISALIIFPCVTARSFTKSFFGLVLASGVCALVCFLVGIMSSIAFNLPIGAAITLTNLCLLLVCKGIVLIKKLA